MQTYCKIQSALGDVNLIFFHASSLGCLIGQNIRHVARIVGTCIELCQSAFS